VASFSVRAFLQSDQVKLRVLRELVRKDGQSVGSLTRRTHSRYQSVLRACLFLQVIGWVEIDAYEGDARTTRYVRFTQTGREQYPMVFARVIFDARR
jgi:hypothetical protein